MTFIVVISKGFFAAHGKTANHDAPRAFLSSNTQGQFNKTFTRVICKCSHCFRL